MTVRRESNTVHVGGVTSELLQRLAGLEAVDVDGHVEGGGDQLGVILAELDARHALRMNTRGIYLTQETLAFFPCSSSITFFLTWCFSSIFC